MRMKSSFFGCLHYNVPAAPAMYMQSPREVTRMLNFLTEGNCGRKPQSAQKRIQHTHTYTHTPTYATLYTHTHMHTPSPFSLQPRKHKVCVVCIDVAHAASKVIQREHNFFLHQCITFINHKQRSAIFSPAPILSCIATRSLTLGFQISPPPYRSLSFLISKAPRLQTIRYTTLNRVSTL